MTNSELSPDFVWIKNRNGSYNNLLFDAVRGVTNYLESNSTNNEDSSSSSLTSFDSNGFTLGTNVHVNRDSGYTYAAWAWDAGSSTVSNTDGSIASQVRANPSAGFSIVSFTASGSAGSDSCGHGLNAVPGMVIIKRRDASDNWFTWHSSFSNAQRNFILLDSTAAITLSTNDSWGAGMTSSVIGFRSQGTAVGNMIAYCFAPVEGYSAMGSYTGTGTSGIFVHTGMSPSWIIIKDTTNNGTNWLIFDSERDPHNLASTFLRANHSGNEIDNQTANGSIDFLSNGFTVRASGTSNANTTINVPNSTVVWMAFAENPFKTARAR